MVDWNKIKAEYIAGGTSYRKLAKKYNIHESALTRIAIKEKWAEARKQAKSKTEAEIINSVSKENAKTGLKINQVANKLIAKLDASIDKLDVIDGGSLKSYTSALKDLKEITNSKSDIDLREQEARIRKLEKEAEKDEKDNEIVVIIGNEETEEYSE